MFLIIHFRRLCYCIINAVMCCSFVGEDKTELLQRDYKGVSCVLMKKVVVQKKRVDLIVNPLFLPYNLELLFNKPAV